MQNVTQDFTMCCMVIIHWSCVYENNQVAFCHTCTFACERWVLCPLPLLFSTVVRTLCVRAKSKATAGLTFSWNKTTLNKGHAIFTQIALLLYSVKCYLWCKTTSIRVGCEWTMPHIDLFLIKLTDTDTDRVSHCSDHDCERLSDNTTPNWFNVLLPIVPKKWRVHNKRGKGKVELKN